ncbi:MAG: DUF2207 family protein [Acidimicrobiales bacterium]
MGRHLLHRVVLATAAALALGVAFAGPAAAKDFSIDRFVVEAIVNADGSMEVVEHLTYNFDGEFNVGDRDIPPGPYYQVVDMQASENGEPRDTVNPNPCCFEWDLGGARGVHTYDLTYTVEGAIRVGTDVGELYWKLVGDNFPGVGEVDITISFPGDGAELRAWAHGPLNGVVDIDRSVVTLTVDDLPAGEFVEARATSPSDNFTFPPEGGDRLPAILDEEEEFAAEANRERQLLKVGQVGAPVAGGLGLLGFFLIWRKWGREPEKPADIGDYWREVPEDPPAIVQSIDSWGSVGGGAFAATVVDLAQRGWLTITESSTDGFFGDKTDYVFTATGKSPDQLTPFEAQLLDRLFRGRGAVSQAQLLDEAKADRNEAASWFSSFKSGVQALYTSRGYEEKGRAGVWGLHFLIVAAVGGVGALAFFGFRLVFGLVAMIIAGVLFLLSPLLRKRSPLGARRKAEVDGLRNFLRDFSRLDEVPIGHMILYERYLVYAVALGVADELLAGLRLRVPEVTQPATGFATWYAVSHLDGHGAYGGETGSHVDGLSSIGSFASDLGSNFSAAFSPPSSSSGGGGGFSGGGGGGGGGGGAGAH